MLVKEDSSRRTTKEYINIVARDLVLYFRQHGPFQNRDDLLDSLVDLAWMRIAKPVPQYM